MAFVGFRPGAHGRREVEMTDKTNGKPKWTGDVGVRISPEWSYPRSVTHIGNNIVEVIHVTTCRDGKAYVKSLFDFTGMVGDVTPADDILECAGGAIVIKARPAEFRTRTVDEVISMQDNVLIAADYFKRERSEKDPVTGAVNALVKIGFSREEAEEIIARKGVDGVNNEAKTILRKRS